MTPKTISNPIENILILRSADIKTVCSAINLLAAEFPGKKILLLAQSGVAGFFKETRNMVDVIEYPFRDFNTSVPLCALSPIPSVSLALSLYKNNGAGYEEVDAFLHTRIRSTLYGHVTGDMSLVYDEHSFIKKQIHRVKGANLLYNGSITAMFKTFSFSSKYCPETSRIIFSGDSKVVIDKGGQLVLAPHSICRFGYVPPNWSGIRKTGDMVVRIQNGGTFECCGSVNIFGGVRINIFPGARLSIGEGSYIAFNSKVFNERQIDIGKNCAISWDVEIMDTNFHPVRFDDNENDRGITIGDHVWIGAGARIMPKVSIGNNAIVGAGAIVTRSFPDNAIIAGNPAKQIGINEGYYRI